MDGLSAAASVIAVVQLTTEVTKYCIDAAGALEDRQLLREEVGACGNLLMDLYKLYANDVEDNKKGDDNGARNDTWANKINVLKSENAPLYRLTQTLDAIKTKLRPEQEKGYRKIKTILKWPFDGKEVSKLIDAMQRERSLLQFALTHESTQLSKEIKETAGENSRQLAELIEHIKVKSTENDHQVAKLSRILTGLQLSNRNIADRVEDLQINQMSARQKEILHWISPMDYAPQQSDIFSRRQPGTGEWLLGSDEYKSWLDTDRQVLFCPGIPGAGKTIMASIVIDSLLELFHAKPDIGVAYIYCNFRRRNEQKATDMVANLLKQLCEGQPALIALAEDLYSRHNPSRKRPSLQELGRTLQAVAARYSRIYIVIDALDECDTDEGTLMIFLQQLHDLQKAASTNVFATSRFNTEIMEMFHHTVHLNIRASDHDVRTYLNDKMTRLPTFVQRKPELQEEIKTKILESVQGMFLLAQLHLDSLIGKRSPKAIRAFLNNLPSNPNTSKAYDTAYNDAMERIEDQVADRTSLGKEALMWISCAKRVLSPLELQHALAIESESEEFDKENLSEIGDIISACAGLITVDEQSNAVRLVHFTTQEYFERTQAHWFPRAASELAIKTMTYLSFDLSPDSSSLNFGQPCLDLENASDDQGTDDTSSNDTSNDGTSNDDNGLGTVFQLYPFCKYASWFWGDHARDVPEMLDTVKEFLASEKFVNNAELMRQDETFNIFDLKTTGLHEATFSGIEGAIEWMVQRHPIDSIDSSGMSALEIACREGHLSAVELLLKNGASFHGTPMTRAAYGGHHAIVACLFQHGSPLESEALMAALPTQNAEPLVRVLLDHGSDTNLHDSDGSTPLQSTILLDEEPLARLLLDYGADVNLPETDSDSPLFTAISKNAESIARLLLDYGAEINLPDSYGDPPLHIAVTGKSESLVQLLLDYGAEINLPDSYGGSPLHNAVSDKSESLVQLLLDHGADINLPDSFDDSPLHIAVSDKSEPLVRLLLDNGADINLRDGDGNSPLLSAIRLEIDPIIHMLLNSGADINFPDSDGISPLHSAVYSNNESLARLLLDYGADVDLPDAAGNTMLRTSLEEFEDHHLASLLLGHGAKVALENNSGTTPFTFAAYKYLLSFVGPALDYDPISDIDLFGTRMSVTWEYDPLLRLLLSHTAETPGHIQALAPSVYDVALKAIEPVVRAMLDPEVEVYLYSDQQDSPTLRSDSDEASSSLRMLMKYGTMTDLRKELAVMLLVCSLRITESLLGRRLLEEDDQSGTKRLFQFVRSGQKYLDQILLQGEVDPEPFRPVGNKSLKVVISRGEKRLQELRRKLNIGDNLSADNDTLCGDHMELSMHLELVDTDALSTDTG